MRLRAYPWLNRQVCPWLTAGLLCILVAPDPFFLAPADSVQAQSPSETEQQARVTCGGCHAFPAPDILPRDAWRNELVRMTDIDEKTLPATIWLEQTKPGTFVRHTIEMGTPRHATLDVGDIDGDGDADIVVGVFSISTPASAWVDVWVNQTNKR